MQRNKSINKISNNRTAISRQTGNVHLFLLWRRACCKHTEFLNLYMVVLPYQTLSGSYMDQIRLDTIIKEVMCRESQITKYRSLLKESVFQLKIFASPHNHNGIIVSLKHQWSSHQILPILRRRELFRTPQGPWQLLARNRYNLTATLTLYNMTKSGKILSGENSSSKTILDQDPCPHCAFSCCST